MRRFFFVLALSLSACAAPVAPSAAPAVPVRATVLPPTPTAAAAVPTDTQPIASGVDADGYHTLGDPAAPVTLTDYSDYF